MTSALKRASLHGQPSVNYKTISVTVRVGEDFCTQVTLLRITNTLNIFDTILKVSRKRHVRNF
jgi:hypothetical protein